MPTPSMIDVMTAIRESTAALNSHIAKQEAHNTRSSDQFNAYTTKQEAQFNVYVTKQDAQNVIINEKLTQMSAEMIAEFSTLHAENKELQNRCTALEAENKALKKSQAQTNSNVERLQMSELQHDIVISGLPEIHDEDPSVLVISIASALDLPLESTDIIKAFRIPSHNPADNDAENKPRQIHATLERITTRNQLLAKARISDELTSDLINPTFPKTKIYINERMTPAAYNLLRMTKACAREKGYKHAWYRYGKIRVKRDDRPETRVILIKSEKDLELIVP